MLNVHIQPVHSKRVIPFNVSFDSSLQYDALGRVDSNLNKKNKYHSEKGGSGGSKIVPNYSRYAMCR